MIFNFLLLCTSVAGSLSAIQDSYQMWCIGVCERDALTTSKPGAVLMGGGTDTNEGFTWQIENANKGDFLILRSSGDDAYNQYVMDLSIATKMPLNTVRTILFKNAKASQETEVLNLLKSAEAIFFAGGDQNDYIEYWAGTEVQSIIQSKLANVTVGGTSAGLAVLGNWVYTGEQGSIISSEAMANPYDKMVTITTAFLRIPFLETFITDTHFGKLSLSVIHRCSTLTSYFFYSLVTRDRMGRMLTFVARIQKDFTNSGIVRSVGVDEHTALLLDVNTGDVRAVGVGTAYVCTPRHNAEVCLSGTPETFKGKSYIEYSHTQCTVIFLKN